MGEMERNKKDVKWGSGVNILAGLWLLVAPLVLGYYSAENIVWNEMVVGGAVLVLALLRTAMPLRFEALSWINFVLGVWLIIAPFLLGFRGAAMINEIVVGILILAMASWSATTTTDE